MKTREQKEEIRQRFNPAFDALLALEAKFRELVDELSPLREELLPLVSAAYEALNAVQCEEMKD